MEDGRLAEGTMKTKKRRMQCKPDPTILADIVKRVVRAAKPEKIVLFGSAARGTMGPRSDIDLLVIKRGKSNHWRLLTTIYNALSEIDIGVDVVLASPETVERYRNSYCLVYYPAMREGKILYETQALSPRRSARVAQSSAKHPRACAGRH